MSSAFERSAESRNSNIENIMNDITENTDARDDRDETIHDAVERYIYALLELER